MHDPGHAQAQMHQGTRDPFLESGLLRPEIVTDSADIS